MSWEETLQQVVRKYYRAGGSDPPAWVNNATGVQPERVALANATCGDRVVVHIEISEGAGDRTRRIWLDVAGCAICKASAEMAVRAGAELSRPELKALTRAMLSSIEASSDAAGTDPLLPTVPTGPIPPEDIETILRLRNVPGRRRCASLPWEAVLQALESSR